MEEGTLCFQCKEAANRDCVLVKGARTGSSIVSVDNPSDLTYLCRKCFTEGGYSYKIVAPFRVLYQVTNPRPLKSAQPCCYCEQNADMNFPSKDYMRAIYPEEQLAPSRRFVCTSCHTLESILYFEMCRPVPGSLDELHRRNELIREQVKTRWNTLTERTNAIRQARTDPVLDMQLKLSYITRGIKNYLK